MKINRVLAWSIGMVGMLVVAGGTYLSLYLDQHKGLLETSISMALGRETKIEEGVSLHWSMTPSIALSGLRVGNPDWATGKYLARAEKALLSIKMMGLLKRRLEVKQVTVQNADIALEMDADGRRNWAFGEASGGGRLLRIDALKVENSRLSFRSPAGVGYRTDIVEITFDGLGEPQPALDAEFTYRGVPVSVSATASAQPIPGSGNRAFKGRVKMPSVTLTVAGELVGTSAFANLDAVVQSERLDLQTSLSPLWPSMPLAGSLEGVAGRFETAGDTIQALAGNLRGKLNVASADLMRPAAGDNEATHIALKALSLNVTPKQPVSLQSELVYDKQNYRVALTGGLLESLFLDDKTWSAVKVKVSGNVDAKQFDISGEVGPLSALHSGRDIKARLSVHQGDLKFVLDGNFASLLELSGSRFSIDASGPSLSRLNPLLGVAMPDTPPLAMTAQVEGGEHHLRFKKITISSGRSELSGELRVPLGQGGRIEGSLASDVLDLQPFLAHQGQPSEHVHPILERELSTAVLRDLDAALRFRVRRLHLDAIELEHVGVDVDLNKGHLKLNVGAENERLAADVELKPIGAKWQIALNHKGKMDLGELIDQKKYREDESQAPLDIQMQIKGTGVSLAGLLKSATGQFTMVIGEGRLSETIARHLPLGSVLYSLVGALLPKDQNKQPGMLECAVVQLDIADGLATSSKGLALRTDQINVLGGGALKLPTGEIDLRFKTANRKGLGISILGVADRLVGVTGTLKKPVVSLNVGSALTYGAAAWATAGLSVLADSIFKRLTAFSDPCEAVLQASKGAQGER